jgi:multidrug efflux pump subunit AcrA (membrane-fusion protein)
MLNISPNNRNQSINPEKYHSLRVVEAKVSGNILTRLIVGFFVVFMLTMFLPWTQNIRAKGNVTAIDPEQRPQTIHSIIGGRIEKWFVREGDFVAKGDTILFISEVKDDYFDPNLLTRTKDQIKSKELSVGSYGDKVKSLDNQIDAMLATSVLKLQQAKLKN